MGTVVARDKLTNTIKISIHDNNLHFLGGRLGWEGW